MMSILPYSLYKIKKMISKIYIDIYISFSTNIDTFNHNNFLYSSHVESDQSLTRRYSIRSMMDPDNGPLSESDVTYVESVASWKVLTST